MSGGAASDFTVGSTAEFDRDRANGGDVRSTSWGSSINLKAGLLNNVDIQFVLDPYAHSRVEDRMAGTVDKASGIGDLQTRLKINLWGNDGGTTAFAVMPFVKWPLAASEVRNGRAEGGCIFILGSELPAGWNVTAMHEVDFVAGADRGHDTAFWGEFLAALYRADENMAVNIEHEDVSLGRIEGLRVAAEVLLEAERLATAPVTA